MIPKISAQAYFDNDIFVREQRSLFSAHWQFAGLTRDLQEDQSYIVTTVGGKSVVIQNFAGAVKAFANVCSHRFSRIRREAKGQGPLRCQYHGWIYNDEGIPYSIPSRPRFDDLTPERLKALALQPYDLATIGMFVFVRERSDGPGLREFLGAAASVLERISDGAGELIDVNELTINANWKINVENTLESYHVGFVHPTTFKKLGASGMDFTFDGPHSSWVAPVEANIASKMEKLVGMLERRTFEVDAYFHQLVFPNLTVASTYGTSFAVQLFQPMAPGVTRLTSYVFYARVPKETARNAAMVELMSKSVAEFNRAVFEEDRQVCEQVQMGVTETGKSGILSDEEERVLHFQSAYAKAMGLS